ncbi:unnamed protein product [Soboliphyme baturini]|uniref:XPA_C domain-containing protein n=1 Tax=Soboliphyme baturini TaxID=241478 RepID=A0A183JAF3_9BILA|nr:unnamed protein product [Soboliphyme baturini]
MLPEEMQEYLEDPQKKETAILAIRYGDPVEQYLTLGYKRVFLMKEDQGEFNSKFQSGLLEAAAECCGLKRVDLPRGSQKRSSWWTREVQLAAKEKKVAFKKYVGNKEPETRMRHGERHKDGSESSGESQS